MKKKSKKYLRDGLSLAATGVGLGVASGLDPTGATGKVAGAMPIVGTLYGAGMVMDGVNYLKQILFRVLARRWSNGYDNGLPAALCQVICMAR